MGRSGGGNAYGYQVVRRIGPDGGAINGERTIDLAQAKAVMQIFRAYAAGASPKRIALTLNAGAIAGPRGGAWSSSSVNGNRSRGTGGTVGACALDNGSRQTTDRAARSNPLGRHWRRAVRKRSASPLTLSRWLVICPPGEKQERLRATCATSTPRLFAPIQQSFAHTMRRSLDPPHSFSFLGAGNRLKHCTLPFLWKRGILPAHTDRRCELGHSRQRERPARPECT